MIVVTGGAGFIGSNLVHALNAAGEREILIVDSMTETKAANLKGAVFTRMMDKQAFRRALVDGTLRTEAVRAILHQGACSDTLRDDVEYVMENNFAYSLDVLHFALREQVPLVYASTAAVYGLARDFAPVPANEQPLNLYGRSKLAFDNAVRTLMAADAGDSSVVGLRYFNVYGPREGHKRRMASVVHRFTKQLRERGVVQLFEGSGGYEHGDQRRDFVSVRDICRINLFFAGLLPTSPVRPVRAIVNAGTGVARSFNELAAILIRERGAGAIEYVPFPVALAGRYQHFTCADSASLHGAGYRYAFASLEEGCKTIHAKIGIETAVF